MTERSRRAILRLGGTAMAASLAGCASVAEQMSNSSGKSKQNTDTSTPATQTTEAQTTEAQTTEAQTTATQTSNQSSNVSSANDTNGSSEKLGKKIDIAESSLSFADVPMPDDPSKYTYARMGADDADATALLLGNWKCPFTQEFVLNRLGDVVDEYVVPGDLALKFRSLAYYEGDPYLGADAPRATRGGLAVWHESPDHYWEYFGTVFTNQPRERYEWATTDRLVRFAEAAGVDDTKAVEDAIFKGKYLSAVRDTTDRAEQLKVSTVPRIVTSDDITAPTVDYSATKSQLDAAVRM